MDPVVKERLEFHLKVWEVPAAFVFWKLKGNNGDPKSCPLPNEP